MVSARAIFVEVSGNDEASRLSCSIAASGAPAADAADSKSFQ
jgi:hypothetical protein